MRKIVGGLEGDELPNGAPDIQCFENFFAARHAHQTLPPRPLAGPIETRIASLKPNPAAVVEMHSYVLKRCQDVGVAEESLEDVPGHEDQVEALLRLVVLCRLLDPLDLVRVRLSPRDIQHR